jgi:hypothetical protein
MCVGSRQGARTKDKNKERNRKRSELHTMAKSIQRVTGKDRNRGKHHWNLQRNSGGMGNEQEIKDNNGNRNQ